jgi:hypothetical protein
MRLVAHALSYRSSKSVRTTRMSVSEMAVDALMKPLRNAADRERSRGKRMQSRFGSG